MYPYFENLNRHIYKSYWNKSYNFPSHFHNNLEISFCFSGNQLVKIGETTYTLGKGDAAIIFPNTVHEYISYDSDCSLETESISIICSPKLIAESIPEIIKKSPDTPFIKASSISENTAYAFRKMVTCTDKVEMIGWTYIALSNLLSCIELTPKERELDLPLKITNYIDTNFRDNLTINYLAKVFGYHPSYIAHIFCDQLKISFKTYLGAVRCEYAASQIKATKKSLTEIAYESGFNSLNTFCRSFKKHFNKTPSQYKKDSNNNSN